ELLDTSDKVQLEVKYRLPPIPLSSRTRTKVTQVSYKIRKSRTFFAVSVANSKVDLSARPNSHLRSIPLVCRTISKYFKRQKNEKTINPTTSLEIHIRKIYEKKLMV
ncbi:MAG: hypothetical protein ACK56I_33055, partial [bacterium]